MENYKEKLKINAIVYGVSAVILAVFSLLSLVSEYGYIELSPVYGDSHWHSMWRGFISGATAALLCFMLFGLVQCIRGLRSEKVLKRLYVEQHDERSIKIWTSARAAAYQISLILGIVAVVIAGYFNMIVSITIMVCLICCSALGLILKIYYSQKL